MPTENSYMLKVWVGFCGSARNPASYAVPLVGNGFNLTSILYVQKLHLCALVHTNNQENVPAVLSIVCSGRS